MIYLYIYMYKVNLHPFLSLPAIDQVWPHRVQHIVCYKWTGGDTKIILVSNINTMCGTLQGLRLFCVFVVKSWWKIVRSVGKLFKRNFPDRLGCDCESSECSKWIDSPGARIQFYDYLSTCDAGLDKLRGRLATQNFSAHSVKTPFFFIKSNN